MWFWKAVRQRPSDRSLQQAMRKLDPGHHPVSAFA